MTIMKIVIVIVIIIMIIIIIIIIITIITLMMTMMMVKLMTIGILFNINSNMFFITILLFYSVSLLRILWFTFMN